MSALDVFAGATRVLAFVVGLLLLFAAGFLYENEEGTLQNRLGDWWLKVADLERAATSRRTALMRWWPLSCKVHWSGFSGNISCPCAPSLALPAYPFRRF